MRTFLLAIVISLITIGPHVAGATDADDTTITITAQTAGLTPFINKLTLLASQTDALASIQFAITPKIGSVTRPLSATYAKDYLISRGDLQAATGQITLPVYGLYAGYANTVTLIYKFTDGSSKQVSTTVTTAAFADPCGYNKPTILQPRSAKTSLSYDYLMIKGSCSNYSPAIIDTDGALRWVGTGGISNLPAIFFDNAIYIANGPKLYRMELDGSVRLIGDYSSIGVVDFHHNIDRGKTGIILDVDTAQYTESVNIEVDASGKVIKQWSMADIISAAMIADKESPSQFVSTSQDDWFHNNAVTYNRADDSLVVSSRENFLICIDYETNAIKWILGDPTKKWHQFPSLGQYALTMAPGSLPPIGQHAVSITYDQDIMVFDNGTASIFQKPPGASRHYASPRKYQLDLTNKVATEVYNYTADESIFSDYCGSVYEDAPHNYLIDYALVNGDGAPNNYAELLGLNAAGQVAFYYQYPTSGCTKAFNSIPLHLENTIFPTAGPQALNLSTRGTVASGDSALIAGFIVTGAASKTVVLRALGPSLSAAGVSGALADPVLTLHNSSGAVIATNDNWQTDLGAAFIETTGLAPTNPSEAALLETLSPGAYTAVVTGNSSAPGIGLVEAYDLSPKTGSLGNISTRGMVEGGDNILVGGFIVGDVASATVVVRALGPSLAASQVSNPLADPNLTIYDRNGSVIATNDNWQEDNSASDIQRMNLAPANPAESATALLLPAGSYTAVVRGAGQTPGVALVEVYDIP